MIKIGLLKEGKIPPDRRIVLTPHHALALMKKYPDIVVVVVEDNQNRCFTNNEYEHAGVEVVQDISDCNILLGVKEVPVNQLIEGKTYMFFSHTIKKQEHNRRLLQEILKKKIRLIDYECLHDVEGNRLIGFGRFAGIVGAQHALVMWGKYTGRYELKRAIEHHDYNLLIESNNNIDFGKVKIFVTGNGRVSKGAVELLEHAGIKKLTVKEYLAYQGDRPVYCQCDMDELYRHKKGKPFDFHHFFSFPEQYECVFDKFFTSTDILINGMFWSPKADRLFQPEDIKKDNFNIRIISDISCDINGSVPLTTRATTIDQPYFGVSRQNIQECEPFIKDEITMMTIDNLPNELPRDASAMFAEVMAERVLPLLIEQPDHPIIYNATIAADGKLNEPFSYLADYVAGQ
ncbi:MAG TPA: NAD(P)-dependent oxidoreductase [Bacteroidia bacterium]|nr:NAD(P)-dependent oxidoreductase [Bacteroidia bacterium]HRS58617.1 NAD(P)-dependent oxidoreductase [Bacteroidia bacterium]HRU68016.1 NAD(P)-dependent oxidoreductase [Bacteroidia bacterium]